MKKLRWMLTALLCIALLVSCNVKTKDDVSQPPATSVTATNETSAPSDPGKVEITLLAMSLSETDVNVLRDQLEKAGFSVKINMQPDFGSYSAQRDAGNYDMMLAGWTTVTGNPDYAVRSVFMSGGDYNKTGINDPELDKLIEEAAAQTPDQYVKTYTELEKVLIDKHAYLVPLYSSYRMLSVNKEVVKPESVILCKSRTTPWERFEFVDGAKNATEPFLMTQQLSELTSLDPIRANDGSINAINSNMYIRLVNLTKTDEVIADGSLSYQYAIAEGNRSYYFVLRDNVNFAKVENKEPVDSGVRVGAEDVVFSMNRAKDKDSVPDHRTFSLHSSMENIEIVTDPKELDGKTAGGKTIREELEAKTPTPIQTLTDDKTAVDNQNGVYQIVRINTVRPFPQVLNFLAHQSAGIVNKEQVEAINNFDVAKYNPETDLSYGDQRTLTEKEGAENHLMTSGPYIMVGKDDYQAVLKKNPGYMKGTDNEARVGTIHMRFIKDADSALSAFRSGEIHALFLIPEDKLPLLESDEKLYVEKLPSNGVTFANFNMINSKFKDEDLRKAVLAAVDQQAFITVYNGLKLPTYSTLSTLIDTGNVLKADPAKVQEYLKKYQEKQ